MTVWVVLFPTRTCSLRAAVNVCAEYIETLGVSKVMVSVDAGRLRCAPVCHNAVFFIQGVHHQATGYLWLKMIAQSTPQFSPFIVRQDVISQRRVAERTGLFRQAVDHMPEVNASGSCFPFFWSDTGAARHFTAAHVTTQAIIPQADA